MLNVTRTGQRAVQLRNGYVKFNSNVLASSKIATGIVQNNFLTHGRQILETAGTGVYADNGTTRKVITGTLTLTDNADALNVFTVIDDKILATNAVDETWYWAGDYTSPTAAAALTGMQWTTCGYLLTHRNLLFAMDLTESGTRHSTRIRWCDIDVFTLTDIDITSWPVKHVYDLY